MKEELKEEMTSLMGSGLTINVKGNNLDKLQELAGEVAKVVENTEGTVDVDDGLANTTPSFTISVDKEKAAKYGMTVAQVFQLVYGEMASSTSATTISTDVNDYQVYVQSEEQSDVTLDDIKKLTFTYTDREGNETEVALSDIAQFEYHDVCCASVYDMKIKRGISAASNVLLFASAYYCLMV